MLRLPFMVRVLVASLSLVFLGFSLSCERFISLYLFLFYFLVLFLSMLSSFPPPSFIDESCDHDRHSSKSPDLNSKSADP